MKKFLYILLVLITPFIEAFGGNSSWGNFNWPASRTYLTYSNEREIITEVWTFTDTAYFDEIIVGFLEVDSIVIEYINAEYLDADSILCRNGLTVQGETVLGNAATDTVDVYGLMNNRANQRVFNASPGIWIFDTDLETGASVDTAAIYMEASTSPTITLYGTDGDNWGIGINTSDQAIFTGASGGYIFDDDILPSASLGIDIGAVALLINNGFFDSLNITTDIINAGILTNNGESFLGNELTDTTTVYRVQHKGSVMFDSLATGVKYLDFSLADNASASAYWLYANSNNYWTTDGSFKAQIISALTELTVGDDKWLTVGTSSDAAFMWETVDENANELIVYLPEGGGTNVPVCVFGDASIWNVDLGWFDGITEPRFVVVDDDADSWQGFGFTADDKPGIMMGGAAKSFTLPNALTLQLHTIAAGDSVVFNFILDATDSTLKYYDNAGWVEYYRQGGTDVVDADIASSATWNARLDTATIVTWADTNVVATQYFVDDMVGDSIANSLGDLSAQIGAVLKDSLNLDTKAEFNALTSDQDFLFKDDSTLYATLTALGTMVGDSVKNTLADLNIQLSVTLKDSSLLDTPTEFKALFVTGEEPLFKSDSADGDGFATPTDLTAYLPLAGGIMSGDIWYGDPGTSANSKTLYFLSDNGTEVDTAAIQAMYGDDPYLRIFAPSDAGSPTAIMDLKDTRIVIGAGTAGIDYEIYLNGETSQGTITYYEDEDMFGFDNGIQANHIQISDGTSLPTGMATYCPVAVKSDSLMISFDNGTTWMHIVTQARAVP